MIGVFDSGLGGLTCLKEIRRLLPQYDYLYLGDNARAPYGTRSYDVVYEYTLQCVKYLFAQGCRLVILACNTASAKALRTIQQHDLPNLAPDRRVLGVIRPTVEVVPNLTHTRHIGIVATEGTVKSNSYTLELQKIAPDIQVTQQACPMWVPLIENKEHTTDGARFFVRKYLQQLFSADPQIDTLVLGCTHYPFLLSLIQDTLKENTEKGTIKSEVQIISQGELLAHSLQDYLKRHPEIESTCSCGGTLTLQTTESADKFAQSASFFLGDTVQAEHIEL